MNSFFFLNATSTTEIYTLSLHDALPILLVVKTAAEPMSIARSVIELLYAIDPKDRKSTRLNSSHRCISYAVFCLKKKKTTSSKAGITRVVAPAARLTRLTALVERALKSA